MAKDPVLPVDDEARALAKKLMRTARSGALATNDAESGTPFASLVQVGTDLDGSPVILTSQLSAAHDACWKPIRAARCSCPPSARAIRWRIRA